MTPVQNKQNDMEMNMKTDKYDISQTGFGIALMFMCLWCWSYFIRPQLGLNDTLNTILNLLALYGVGLFVFYMIIRPAKAPQMQTKKPSAKMLATAFVMQCAGMPVMGVMMVLRMILTGVKPDSAALPLTPYNAFQLLLFAPVTEEFVFRRLFAAKLLPYGERVFILTSALCFSIVHGVSLGVPQIAYTFVLGLVWAYVYVKTGSLLYSIILHSLSNFAGAIISQLIMLVSETASSVYSMLLMMTGTAGLILFCIKLKKIRLDGDRKPMDAGVLKTVFGNAGILFDIAATAAMIFYKVVCTQ